MAIIRITLVVIFTLITFAGNGWSAQSTADVPVTETMKTAARQEILDMASLKVGGDDKYVVGVGDVLSVQVYGEGDMSATLPGTRVGQERGEDAAKTGSSGVQVRSDGRISLKHIGDVEAVDFTLTQLADFLKVIYASVYEDPVVIVVLVQSKSRRYTVMGKVASPGTHYLDYPMNIVQAIASCGGFTEWAKSEVRLIRQHLSRDAKLFKGNKLIFDYDDFLDGKDLERNVRIRPGDIIIVD